MPVDLGSHEALLSGLAQGLHFIGEFQRRVPDRTEDVLLATSGLADAVPTPKTSGPLPDAGAPEARRTCILPV